MNNKDFFELIEEKYKKARTIDFEKINYLIGHLNICDIDFSQCLKVKILKDNSKISYEIKIKELVKSLKLKYNFPDAFLECMAREKLGIPFTQEEIDIKRKIFLRQQRREHKQNELYEKNQKKELLKELKKKDQMLQKHFGEFEVKFDNTF